MRKTLSLFTLVGLTVMSTSNAPLLIGNQAYAQSSPFYQGKTIRIVVATDSGGLYDL